MKRIAVALAFLMFWGGASADLVARNSGNELRLQHTACVHAGILGQLREEWRPKFKKAVATVAGKMHYACWIDTMDGAYFVVWEDGSAAGYPIAGFLDEPGV